MIRKREGHPHGKKLGFGTALVIYGGLFYLTVVIYALTVGNSAAAQVTRIGTVAVVIGVLVPLMSIAYGVMGGILGGAGRLLCMGNGMLVSLLIAAIYEFDEMYGRLTVCGFVFLAVYFFTSAVRVISAFFLRCRKKDF